MLASITMVSSCCLACRGDTHLAMCGAGDDGGSSIEVWTATAVAERWSILPDDILSLVYAKLANSVDRVRLAAVSPRG